jgi:hypothetical protein
MGVKEKIKNRLNQYKNNRMLGPFLRYAVQRKGRRDMPTTLVDYTEQGARIIDKPSDIKKENVELTEEHMSKGRQKYFIHHHKLMQEMEADSKWAKQVCNTRSSKKWEKLMKNIPAELRTVFKHARISKRLKKDMYGDIFTSHITLAKLDWYLAKRKNNTAPGVSGIRIDHIAALPKEHREIIAQLLSIQRDP